MSRRQCVAFSNHEGLALRGVLDEPSQTLARGICVLLLSPGIKGRVGPHRLYIKISERLVPLGFHVLRFDYSGLGDSEGEIEESALVDVYNSIHSGRYVQDTIAAMDWAQETLGIERFVGSGLCGGSISALLTAEVDRRVECLLGIGLPTVLEGGPENWSRILTRQQVTSLRSSYLRKLLDPKAWRRFLAGNSDYRAIKRVVTDGVASRRAKTSAVRSLGVRSGSDNTNPRFSSAFMSLLESDRRALLIYSGADRLAGQFAENFEAYNQSRLRALRHLYQVHVIPDANHVVSDPDWIEELFRVSVEWLIAGFGSRNQASGRRAPAFE